MKPIIGITCGLLAACLMLSGCLTSAPRTEEPCWSCNGQRLVRIEPKSTGGGSSLPRPFTHPLSLPQSQWETILRSVQVQSIHRPLVGASYHGATESLFDDEEVRELSGALQRAFHEMMPEQRVVFVLKRKGEAGLPQFTSGAWFIDQDRIHLQLANVRVTVTMPAIRTLIWKDPLAAQPGVFYELAPGDHQVLGQDKRASASPFRETLAELVIDYRAMTGPKTFPTATPVEAPAPPRSPSIEDSLGQLKHLYEQGLITEEDYRTKKQELLDRL